MQFGSLEEFQEEFKDINQEEQISRLHKMLAPHLLRSIYLKLTLIYSWRHLISVIASVSFSCMSVLIMVIIYDILVIDHHASSVSIREIAVMFETFNVGKIFGSFLCFKTISKFYLMQNRKKCLIRVLKLFFGFLKEKILNPTKLIPTAIFVMCLVLTFRPPSLSSPLDPIVLPIWVSQPPLWWWYMFHIKNDRMVFVLF